MRKWIGVLGVILVVNLLVCCREKKEVASIQLANTSTPSPTPRDNSLGEASYRYKGCNTCHGDKGEGRNKLTRPFGEDNFDYRKFKKVILKGKGVMPPYQGVISEKELCCLYKYVLENIQGKTDDYQCAPCSYPRID